jgi:RNA polymerase sigma-70 factor, ECF subfamily
MTAVKQEMGDDERFAGWVREHGRAVQGFLLARVRHADLADDLYQEVFRRAWQARHRYGEQGKARAYLLQIADRLVTDHRRRDKHQVNLDAVGWKQCEPPSPMAEPSQAAVASEEMKRLAAVLEQLSPVQQRVLLLRYYGQMGFAEIAETIGCPLSTTLSHCRRGLETLRTLLVEKKP